MHEAKQHGQNPSLFASTSIDIRNEATAAFINRNCDDRYSLKGYNHRVSRDFREAPIGDVGLW